MGLYEAHRLDVRLLRRLYQACVLMHNTGPTHLFYNKNFLKKLTASRDGLVKVEKQSRNENTRKLPYYRKMMVKQD